jgi:hypothetical protein
MTDFFLWLTAGSTSSIFFIVIVGIISLGIPLLFVIAFFQGREITIWPPKIGERPNKLLLQVSKDVKSLVEAKPQEYSHFRYYKDRDEFNKLGIEILYGAISGDTIYVILRTGTFIGDFSKALEEFRSKNDTHMIVIVPDRKVFLGKFGEPLQKWINELYENPKCDGVRALILEPGKGNPSEARLKGYFFISDGVTQTDDDGFYAKTNLSSKFLLGYCKMLVFSGTQIDLQRIHLNNEK